MVGIGLIPGGRPEIPALLTGAPRAGVTITVVRGAQTKAFVLYLTAAASANSDERGIAAGPLLATRGLY